MLPVEERVNKKSVVLRNKGILLEHDVENKGADKSPLLNTENHLLLLKELMLYSRNRRSESRLNFAHKAVGFCFLRREMWISSIV